MIRVGPFALLLAVLLASLGRAEDQPVVNSLGMKFVPVPVPGAKPVLFCIWKTRVKDFAAFTNDANYNATKDMYSLTASGKQDRNVANWKAPGFAQTEEHPVCGISHVDAVAFCTWLSKKEGKHYRLPTDREWSCAAGIGDRETGDSPRERHKKLQGVFPWGTQWPPPQGTGNFAGKECQGAKVLPQNYAVIDGYEDGFIFTSPVGSFGANALGLYDLGGNLWEWCDDWMDTDHRHRVLRGGSWADYLPECLLASFRFHDRPETRGTVYGFRVVLDE
jgi:formylglycine-generating enzyme required for sulfatase activity